MVGECDHSTLVGSHPAVTGRARCHCSSRSAFSTSRRERVLSWERRRHGQWRTGLRIGREQERRSRLLLRARSETVVGASQRRPLEGTEAQVRRRLGGYPRLGTPAANPRFVRASLWPLPQVHVANPRRVSRLKPRLTTDRPCRDASPSPELTPDPMSWSMGSQCAILPSRQCRL